jgi:hypothetical protein
MPIEIKKVIGPMLGGVKRDVAPILLPPNFAYDARNLSFSECCVEKSLGSHQLGSSFDEIVLGVCQFAKSSGELNTVAVTENGIYARSAVSGEWGSILGTTPFESSFTNTPRFCVMNDTLLIANRNNTIQMWENVLNPVQDIPGSPAYYPKDIIDYKYRMIALAGYEGVTEVPRQIRWTNVGTYSDFTNGFAGTMLLADTPGIIQTGKKLAEFLIIYKTDAICVVQYIGGSSVFTQDTRVMGYGLVAPRAVVNLGSRHWYLSEDNIYEFDGGREPRAVGNAIKKILFSQGRPDMLYKSVACRYGSIVYFIVPMNSENPDTAFAYDLQAQNWSILDWPATAIGNYIDATVLTIGGLEGTIGDLAGIIGELGRSAQSSQIIYGDANGLVGKADASLAQWNDADLTAYWESGDMVFPVDEAKQDWSQFRLRGVDVYARGSGELSIHVSVDSGESWELCGTVTLADSLAWLKGTKDLIGNKLRVKLVSSGSFYIQGLKIRLKVGVANG